MSLSIATQNENQTDVAFGTNHVRQPRRRCKSDTNRSEHRP